MHRYGDTRVIGSILRHVKGPVCVAIPKRHWELSIKLVRALGCPVQNAEASTPCVGPFP